MESRLIAQCTGSTQEDAEKYTDWLTLVMEEREITTPLRQAAFLATIAVESVNLSKTEEDLYYKDAARLANLYKRAFNSAEDALPYVRNPKALGQLLYDGYWGRGLIQLTWDYNYKNAGDDLGVDLLSEPGLVAQPEYAVKTAGWYWADNKCNESADANDMRAVTRKVNGPKLMHLDQRVSLFEAGKDFLA